MTRAFEPAKADEEISIADVNVALVASRFNEPITQKLLEGALEALRRHAIADDRADVIWVPGAFEIPLAAKYLAESGRYQAVVCLGAVIRGETAHFEFVAGQAAAGIMRVGLDTGVPVSFGVLTTENVQQADARSAEGDGNKGFEAVETALLMAQLRERICRPGGK